MTPKKRLDILEAAVGSMPKPDSGATVPERVAAMLACPEAIAWELNFDYHHFHDDEFGGQLDTGIAPERKIDFTGMTEDERGEAISKAYELWLIDHPHPLAETE